MRCEKDVRRFQVAMDDVFIMERGERGEDLEGDPYGLGNGQCSPSEAIVERLTVEKLHDEERLVVVLFDTVELANVRVANLRRRARFAPKPFLRALVLL